MKGMFTRVPGKRFIVIQAIPHLEWTVQSIEEEQAWRMRERGEKVFDTPAQAHVVCDKLNVKRLERMGAPIRTTVAYWRDSGHAAFCRDPKTKDVHVFNFEDGCWAYGFRAYAPSRVKPRPRLLIVEDINLHPDGIVA